MRVCVGCGHFGNERNRKYPKSADSVSVVQRALNSQYAKTTAEDPVFGGKFKSVARKFKIAHSEI